jgi:hypothetical protein
MLVYDYLDIRSHFQLAMTCKSILQYYLRGVNIGSSLYSMPAIRSGLHIKQSMLRRQHPLFKIIETYYEGNHFRVLDPAPYEWLQRLGCVSGCCGCECVLSELKDVAQGEQMQIKFDIRNQARMFFVDRRREPKNVQTSPYYVEASEQCGYYPFVVDDKALFCMCYLCFEKAHSSLSRTGYGGAIRNFKLFSPFHLSSQESSRMAQTMSRYHSTDVLVSALLPVLLLRSLFTQNTSVGQYPALSLTDNQRNVVSPPASCSPLEKMLAELVPEVFGYVKEEAGSGSEKIQAIWRSAPVMAYLNHVRRSLDNSFVQMWQLMEYSLACEVLQQGPPFPACMRSHADDDGDDGEDHVEGTYSEEGPPFISEGILSKAMELNHRVIQAHATWSERWAAIRFRAEKRHHAEEYFNDADEDDSEGENLTDITPFHTAIW